MRGSRELTLNADDKKVRQALLNLVLNAMQASTRGTTVTLEVAKSCADGSAVVRIMDRGAGMGPEVLDRIRKPYYTTKEGGSGLGIAVARGIIEQHGGSLRFESTSGRGTTATVLFPACACARRRRKLPNPCRPAIRGESPARGSAASVRASRAGRRRVGGPEKVSTCRRARKSAHGARPGHRRRVRDALHAEAVLGDAGFEVHTRDGGAAGIAAFEAHGADVVITDLAMPEVDGMKVLATLRVQDPACP